MQFSTPVSILPQPFGLSFRDKLLLVGSCFAEEIGSLLVENKFNADVNPFGTLYNPLSLEVSLRRLMCPQLFNSASDLFFHEDMYHSFLHHSRFSSASPEAAIEMMNQRLLKSSSQLMNATRLIVTWGTAFVYRLESNGTVVGNCHKLPSSCFIRQQLEVDDIFNNWNNLLSELWKLNPRLRVIITVSPIRHWKDGAHGNQISKAILMLAAERLKQLYPELISYFPAYEIMMDELRDYRFYAEDMLHPSSTAVEYIWEKFRNSFFDSETHTVYNAWQPVRKALKHTTFNREGESYRKFITQTMLKAKDISEKFPYFDTSNEVSFLQSKL